MSTTWSIEHIPANGGASTFASLAVWGLAGLRMQFVNWGVDQAAITTRGGSIAFDAAQFAYLDKIVVWRNGSRHSHWWIIGPALNAETQESRTYTLAGPSWWLDSTPFQHPQHVVDITTDPETGAATGCTWQMLHGTEVVWTSWTAQSSGSINGQINRALYCAIDNGAPIGIGDVAMSGLAAPVSGSGTCLSVMQQAARLLPRSACWWDSSGAIPLFHASSRAGLTSQTLTIGTHDIEAFGLQPRADQRIDSVRVAYTYPNGNTTAAWFDNAGDSTLKDGPNTLRAVVECSTSTIAANAASHYWIAAQLYGALRETQWEGSVILHDTGAGLPAILLGAKLCLAGGRAEWETMNASVRDVSISISESVNDVMSVSLGPPPALGAQDIFEALNLLTRAGVGAVSTTGGTSEPAAPATDGTTPGTLADLNGTSTGGGEPGGSIPVQSRGGAWTLVGYPELNIGAELATMPPPRYRQLTRGGSVRTDYYQWGDNTCGTPNGYYRLSTWAGSCQYSASTGLLSGSAARTDRAPEGITTVVQLGCVYESGFGDGFSVTSHSHAETTPQSCMYTESNHYGSYARTTGIGVVTLSDPDTSDAAIARLLATAEWVSTPTTAIRTVPTTGITGIYRRIRYRTEHTAAASSSHWVFGACVDEVWVPGHSVTVSESTVYPTLTGLAIWTRYRLKIVMQRRPVDAAGAAAGDYATGETIYSAPFSTDINGEGGVDWTEIEPESGYETAIQSAIPELY